MDTSIYHSDNENLNKLLDGIVAEMNGYAKAQGITSSLSDTADNPLTDTLSAIIGKVKDYADTQLSHITKLNEIGIALSSEQNLQKLH